MHARCNNVSDKAYENYGGRGISVCDRWADFAFFLSDMGPRPPGKSIDRYPDRNGNYEPGNCRWATPMEQTQNRRNTVEVQVGEKVWPLGDLCREFGLNYYTVWNRVKRGESLETLLRKPGRVRNEKGQFHEL